MGDLPAHQFFGSGNLGKVGEGLGEAVLPDEHTVLQEGDLVHLLVNEKQVAETEKMLAKSPAGA